MLYVRVTDINYTTRRGVCIRREYSTSRTRVRVVCIIFCILLVVVHVYSTRVCILCILYSIVSYTVSLQFYLRQRGIEGKVPERSKENGIMMRYIN